MASESADDINVGVTLNTALFLPKDLDRNAELSEYENYALMLQHFIQREASSMKKEIKSLESKMRKLEDQAEAATKAQQMAKEKVESAEAIRKVAEAEKKGAEAKKAQAEKELQQALATKEPEVKEADEKAYAQVEDESETEADAEDEDEGKNDDEALVRKPKDAAEAKSPPSAEQVMDLTLDEEGDEVGEAPKEIAIGQLSSDLLLAERNLDNTLAEIDAEIEAEKVAEEVPPESSEVLVPAAANTDES
ncbi:methyl-CpG-binding domain-containing protein 10-like [Camellia sinensis]|uniref:methyl-CpG-binding domain-containing protein 10-like n=1 Tax=Camellia sinensis TaxID=4442 RepID=UPI001036BDE3|nr:methyl-CpG-binding domain-containing protein 10-like [Camellia sinensis]